MISTLTSIADWAGHIWPGFFNHLWQSTLFAGLALVAATLLKRGPARVRHAIWMIASAKFAIPAGVLAAVFAEVWDNVILPHRSTPSPDPGLHTTTIAISQIAAPVIGQFHDTGGVFAFGSPRISWATAVYLFLTAIWMAGAVAFLASWLIRRWRFSRQVAQATPAYSGREARAVESAQVALSVERPVGLVLADDIREPGVWGVRNPILILPRRLIDELTDSELASVMLHEMAHVKRSDNIVSNLQMVICCVLWFCQVVWLLDRKLLAERELACDERVLALSSEPESYLASILKAADSDLFARAIAGLSCVTGSNLRRRIEIIVAKNKEGNVAGNRRSLRPGGLIIMAVVAFTVFSAGAGWLDRMRAAAQEKKQEGGASVQRTGGPRDGVIGGVQGGVPGGVIGGVAGGIRDGVAGGVPGGIEDQTRGSIRLSSQALRENPTLAEMLRQAPEVVIPCKTFDSNAGSLPIEITSASAKVITREQLQRAGLPEGLSAEYMGAEYTGLAKIRIINRGAQAIRGLYVGAFCKTPNGGSTGFLEGKSGLAIAPGDPFTVLLGGESPILLAGGSDAFLATVMGVEFEDGTAWGAPMPASMNKRESTVVGYGPPIRPTPSNEPAAGSSENPGMVRKSGGILSATALTRVEPDYPQLAKAARVMGAVTVEVVIDRDGNVESARALAGHPLLKEAAAAAARQWRWAPTTIDGAAVKVVGTVTFNFQM